MAASNSPPIGLSHPTVNPHPDAVPPHGRAERCACGDCNYTAEIDANVPPKCPDCGGALTRVRRE